MYEYVNIKEHNKIKNKSTASAKHKRKKCFYARRLLFKIVCDGSLNLNSFLSSIGGDTFFLLSGVKLAVVKLAERRCNEFPRHYNSCASCVYSIWDSTCQRIPWTLLLNPLDIAMNPPDTSIVCKLCLFNTALDMSKRSVDIAFEFP